MPLKNPLESVWTTVLLGLVLTGLLYAALRMMPPSAATEPAAGNASVEASASAGTEPTAESTADSPAEPAGTPAEPATP